MKMRVVIVDDIFKRLLAQFKRSLEYLRPWVARSGEFARSRRARKIGLIVVAVIAFLGVATYFAVPPILRHIVTGPVAASIHRRVSIGRIRFNLYRLSLDVDKLHVGERDSPAAFVDVGHLRVKVSWASLFRFAPVVGEVTIDRPAIHVVRAKEQRFNFSDLLEGAPVDKSKPTPASAPMRFAVSNIQIRDGDVRFDDQLLGEHHAVEHIQINVPFIANLPADVDIFVEPLVEMVVDGSRLHIAGVAKPFGVGRDSVLDLKLHRLDLREYLGYVPRKLPIKIPKGTLSADVYVHFVLEQSRPLIRLNGTVAVDQLDVRDAGNAPVIALTHGEVKLTDVEPLGAVVYLRSIRIDGLNTHIVVNPDGSNNLTAIVASNPPPAGAQTQATITQTRTAAPVQSSSPTDFALESFELTNSAVEYKDNSAATPAVLAMDGIHIGLQNVRTLGQVPATYTMNVKIRSGGSIAVKGGLDLGQAQATSDVTLDQIDLPALQAFAQSAFAGNIASGKLSAKANLLTHFPSGHFNLHAEPASVSIDNFAVHAPHERETPAQWKNFSVMIGQFDLAGHTATVNQVRADGMHLFVRRERNGKLSLASLMRGANQPPHKNRGAERAAVKPRIKNNVPPAPPAAPGESWKYQIASIALEQTDATFEDYTAPRPIKLALAPLNLHLKDVSSDLGKPFAVDIDGTLNRKGTFKVTGTAAPNPLKADLHVGTQRLDISFADPYVSSRLNATITSANLTMDGAVGLAQAGNDFLVNYRGDATLGSVRMLDKLTNDLFFRMSALNVNKIDFALGKGPPKVHVGELGLNDFYSRIILNSTGKLNVKDITASPQEAPTSLTRATGEPGSKGAVPVAPTPTPAAAPSQAAVMAPGAAPAASPSPAEPYTGQPMNADIEVSKITLKGGKVDYTDNFIKPNYTANLSDMEGKVGAFGTKSTSPADVSLDGKINGSAPINIDGSINPLAPTAFVDMKAKANGIELTGLTPYMTKYTGYPIVKGTLTVDVHYLLDQGKLTAENHIFIDQLTFGEHVDSPDATNLPIRLAVSLLKNSKGQIDLRIPVSGSLSDPQFSIGSLILGAFMNLIVKAATSPFTLIAAAFGGSGEQQDLGYIEFAPGYSTLTPDSQKKLDTVAAALQDRTALKLNISGRVDPKFDTDGYREASLEHSIEVLRRKDEGDSASANVKPVALSAADYSKYLARVYSAGKFKKPRDFIGLAKTEPPDEMKKLILTNTAVSDQDLQHLADARADAVRAYLSTKQVDAGRMFVIAPKLDASGIKDQGKTTRVDLSLE